MAIARLCAGERHADAGLSDHGKQCVLLFGTGKNACAEDPFGLCEIKNRSPGIRGANDSVRLICTDFFQQTRKPRQMAAFGAQDFCEYAARALVERMLA